MRTIYWTDAGDEHDRARHAGRRTPSTTSCRMALIEAVWNRGGRRRRQDVLERLGGGDSGAPTWTVRQSRPWVRSARTNGIAVDAAGGRNLLDRLRREPDPARQPGRFRGRRLGRYHPGQSLRHRPGRDGRQDLLDRRRHREDSARRPRRLAGRRPGDCRLAQVRAGWRSTWPAARCTGPIARRTKSSAPTWTAARWKTW